MAYIRHCCLELDFKLYAKQDFNGLLNTKFCASLLNNVKKLNKYVWRPDSLLAFPGISNTT